MSPAAWEIHHASLGKQRVDPANALISLQFFGRPVTLPWPDGFASGGGKEVPKSGTPVVVRVKDAFRRTEYPAECSGPPHLLGP
jgi:hypothetical protein